MTVPIMSGGTFAAVELRNGGNVDNSGTGALTFSWGQLFRDNRYSSADRQADANQLNLALTSRLLRESDGKERLSASIGQIKRRSASQNETKSPLLSIR